MATDDARGYWRLVACLQVLREGSVGLSSRFCNASFDGVLCWPPTPHGMTVWQPCPTDHGGFISGRYARRTCGVDSFWAKPNNSWLGGQNNKGWTDIVNDQIGYTDYRDCGNLTMDVAQLTPEFTGVGAMMEVTPIEILGYVFKSMSILTLFVSVCLYGCCVPAKTERFKIFIPMCLSAMLKYVVSLVSMAVWRYELDTQQVTFWRDPIVCKVAYTVTRFSEVSVYSWIAVLGVYYLFAVLGDIIKDRRIMVLYLVGLGIPVVFASAWAMTVTFVLSTDVCTGGHIPHATHWITDAPKLACVLIAFCIFIVCVYAACKGLIDEEVPEFTYVKQGTMKCLLLLVLSTSADLYILVSVYNERTMNQELSLSYPWTSYIDMIVESVPGTIIAILVCFVDSEVYKCGKKPRAVDIVMVETTDTC